MFLKQALGFAIKYFHPALAPYFVLLVASLKEKNLRFCACPLNVSNSTKLLYAKFTF